MKRWNYLLLIGLMLTSTSLLSAKTLQPFYFDRPNAHIERMAEMTDAQAVFFTQYESALQQAEKENDMSKYFIVEEAEDPSDSVSHLLGDILYDQGEPYNRLCPIVNGRRAVTGCVATAMAQIMRYYRYPSCGIGKVTYSGGNEGAKTIDLTNYPFDWSLIKANYNDSYSKEEGDAVAKLMLACGASLNMNYSADGSGTQTSGTVKAFKNHFGFSSNIEHFDSENASDPEGLILNDWVYTIREQHQQGYPVIYAGSPASGMSGHAFILDGYKVIDGVYYYHVNWGWSGAYNGYYLIMQLNPQGENYAGHGCDMVINIFPDGWTDVEDVVTPNVGNGKIYNLLGVEVDENYKGVVIKNGKKYIQ